MRRDAMHNYTKYRCETGKCLQLVLDFKSSWLKDELKKAVFNDDIVAFYRKYAENRNYAHLFFENVRIFLLEFFSRILTSDFERNSDGLVRKNCAVRKAQKAVENNDVNALLAMIDSHALLHSKGEQIAFESMKYEASLMAQNEDEESAEEKLEKCTKSDIVMGLQKLHAEGMHERELRELCVTYSVDYDDIAALKTYVQTTLDVA